MNTRLSVSGQLSAYCMTQLYVSTSAHPPIFCPNTLFRPFERFLEPAIYMIQLEEYIQKARELVEEKARKLAKKKREASSCGSAAGVGGIGAVAGAGRIVVACGGGSMEGWEHVQSIGIAIGIRT